MALIDELAKRFGDVVKRVGEKSEQLVELGKLNYELFKEEDAIKKLYREIGQAVYEAYKQESNSLNDIYRLCREIDERKEKIEELKKQVDSVKKEDQGYQTAQTRQEHNGQPGDFEKGKRDAGQGTERDAGIETGETSDEKHLQEGI